MNKVTQAEASQLRAALEAGRRGAASLTQLATAHDLAVSLGADQVAAELRARLHVTTAWPATSTVEKSRVARDLALGIVSGTLTHLVLQGS